MSDAFDVIPFQDIKGDWKKLGSGSFGNVYKGNYLGIDVAIKEVVPSTSYDVAKYFEREWRLMKEARHPNVVLYLGLSRAPPPDNRIFIISEYIENGNLRMYIYDKKRPFPWQLRMSFATDIARALAYLHARKCIHRDLKGENLLVTANARLKITDFGFARIAARNEEESKRLTFCGTDSYMSPEILMGDEFDLPTDIFSLGVIFCEIAARRLADDDHFKRQGPTFGIEAEEVRRLANPDCPPAFVELCLECLAIDPAKRPDTRQILERLREIEAEVLMRAEAGELHMGSVKFMTAGGSKRPRAAPRIPSFGQGIGKDIRQSQIGDAAENAMSGGEESSDEEELMEAISGLNVSLHLNSDWSEATDGHNASDNSAQPLINSTSSKLSDYSTTVIRGHHTPTATETQPPSLSSILTIRPAQNPNGTALPSTPPRPTEPSVIENSSSSIESPVTDSTGSGSKGTQMTNTPPSTTTSSMTTTPPTANSLMSIETYRTAESSTASTTAATKGFSSIMTNIPLVHRFTLLRPGTKRTSMNGHGSPAATTKGRSTSPTRQGEAASWSPLELLFSSGLLVQKCDICMKRIGWKPCLECDDCGLRTHVKCGELAPRDCGTRAMMGRAGNHIIHGHGSPLSKTNKPTPKRTSLPATGAPR
ncbi:kinase-like protein [Coniophora puteana RWD-64-598 SS2]|uniref:Kinase-like protein n=1 Tax=Coniophora puteana (strain RWD-64-598) TaxID=741705 RepID=A0A5M3MCF2_CONPW|nr:kinase-like protein [Coniophora puteana RWD-64-598 SS2]EIW76706.1 kinase-like protein [Coniophora puteana RWD-64-598 SS2]